MYCIMLAVRNSALNRAIMPRQTSGGVSLSRSKRCTAVSASRKRRGGLEVRIAVLHCSFGDSGSFGVAYLTPADAFENDGMLFAYIHRSISTESTLPAALVVAC